MSESPRVSFKEALASADDDSPGPIGELKVAFLEYQRLISNELKARGIAYTHHDELVQHLRESFGATYDYFSHLVSFIEFILTLIKRKTSIKGKPSFQIPEFSISQSLHETIRAQRLKSRPTLECYMPPEKVESTIDNIRNALCQLCSILQTEVLTPIALWELEVGKSHTKEKCFGKFLQEEGSEKDILPGGKHRAVCKLIVYDRGGKFDGTGFLVNKDTLVTAAHNVYDGGVFATRVKVCVGYHGWEHVQPEVRWGKQVAIHWDYLNNSDDIDGIAHDFAVIRLNKPLEYVNKYIKYGSNSQLPEIVVVGYPCDIPQCEKKKGRYMYISEGPKAGVESGILSYKLDTESGNSGSPVLEILSDGTLRAIGVHHGGSEDESNYAAMINHMGNNIPTFERSFNIWENGGGQLIVEPMMTDFWKVLA